MGVLPQNIAILDPLKQKLYLGHIFLTIVFSPLIIAAICSNWYTIKTPLDNFYFGLFGYLIVSYDNEGGSTSSANQSGGANSVGYGGLSIKHTFAAVAAFEILSIIPLLAIYYGHFKLFYKSRNSDKVRRLTMFFSGGLVFLQLLAFLTFFSITSNFKKDNFLECDGQLYCHSLSGNAQSTIWKPLSGLWLILCTLLFCVFNFLATLILNSDRTQFVHKPLLFSNEPNRETPGYNAL